MPFRLIIAAAFLFLSTGVAAQTYPSKPVTLVVPVPPGGLVDTSARIVVEPLSKLLGQPVVIDNKPGASGNIAYQGAARAPKDGYTILVSYSAYHVGNPALFAKLPWDVKDFAPVALMTVATNVIAVHPSVPATTLKEFIDYARKNPGKLNYASQGNGSLSHIGTAMFLQATNTDMQHVAYKGSGDAIKDVLSGQVQVFITTPPSVMGHVQSGKLKALAIAGKNRHPSLPNVPTAAEAGLPGFELEAWVGLSSLRERRAVIAKLSEEVKRALEQPETAQRAAAAGVEVRYQGPEALAAQVRRELEFWSKTIKTAGITAD